MTRRGTADRLRLVMLNGSRFLFALAVFGVAELVTGDVLDAPRMPLWLVLIATAVVAWLFWLTGDRLQRLVDRVVFGEQAGGYEAGRALLRRMATTLPVDEIVPALAETAGRTMHSTRAEVRLLLSDGEPWSQVWPVRAVGEGSPIMVGVRHAGTAVGEIEVDLSDAAESGRDRLLLDDLARPAGLALSTVRLTVELRRRAADLDELTEQLELSNRRIVWARREEIDRLRGEMLDRVMPHIDRAQALLDQELDQETGSLSDGPPVADGPAGTGGDPDRLEQARTEVADALEALRILARGIYPPRLDDAGLAVSLEGWQQRSGIGVNLALLGDEGTLHQRPDVESCLYFSLVTAVAALANGSRPTATVHIAPDDVSATVTGTAGVGARADEACAAALVAVRDRVEAFGGRMDTPPMPADASRPAEPTALDGPVGSEPAGGAGPGRSITVRLHVPFAPAGIGLIGALSTEMGEQPLAASRYAAAPADGSPR